MAPLCGRVYGPRKGLRKNVQCMSASSIHILYNHTPSRAVAAPPRRCTRYEIFSQPEVVRHMDRGPGFADAGVGKAEQPSSPRVLVDTIVGSLFFLPPWPSIRLG